MISQSSKPVVQATGAESNLRTLAQLFKLDLDLMFNSWNQGKPMRTGYPHASNILAIDSEFCLRKLVLMALYPDEAERPAVKPWDGHQNAVFLNGWTLHEKYQDLFKRFGRVIYTNEKPELDLTHFDDERLLFFSPDAIIEHCNEVMPVEIKGYKHSTFEKLDESGPAPEAAHHQVNLYMHLLGLQHALILVEDKDTQEFKVWCVTYNRQLVQPYLDRIYKFKGALARAKQQGAEPPARVCRSSGDRLAQKCEMCRFCFQQ